MSKTWNAPTLYKARSSSAPPPSPHFILHPSSLDPPLSLQGHFDLKYSVNDSDSLRLTMIAKLLQTDEEPVVLHETLKTTFTGIVHPLSTLDALVHQYRGIKYASVPARFRQSKLCTSYPPQTDATRHGYVHVLRLTPT